jgi:hypothetical protein
MEHKMTFDSIWEQEEQQGLQQRLRQDYPAWLRRRRMRRTIMATVVVAIAVISPFTFHLSPAHGYDYVACNRSGIAESHWAKVASNILTIETL